MRGPERAEPPPSAQRCAGAAGAPPSPGLPRPAAGTQTPDLPADGRPAARLAPLACELLGQGPASHCPEPVLAGAAEQLRGCRWSREPRRPGRRLEAATGVGPRALSPASPARPASPGPGRKEGCVGAPRPRDRAEESRGRARVVGRGGDTGGCPGPARHSQYTKARAFRSTIRVSQKVPAWRWAGEPAGSRAGAGGDSGSGCEYPVFRLLSDSSGAAIVGPSARMCGEGALPEAPPIVGGPASPRSALPTLESPTHTPGGPAPSSRPRPRAGAGARSLLPSQSSLGAAAGRVRDRVPGRWCASPDPNSLGHARVPSVSPRCRGPGALPQPGAFPPNTCPGEGGLQKPWRYCHSVPLPHS